MQEYTIKIKQIDLVNHKIEETSNRRIRYNEKDFDFLVVRFMINENRVRVFIIASKYLPKNDSIHLKYIPYTETIIWSPNNISSKVAEITHCM